LALQKLRRVFSAKRKPDVGPTRHSNESFVVHCSVPRSAEAVEAGAGELPADRARSGRRRCAVRGRRRRQRPTSAQHSHVLLRTSAAHHHRRRLLHAHAVVLRPTRHRHPLRRHRHHGTYCHTAAQAG